MREVFVTHTLRDGEFLEELRYALRSAGIGLIEPQGLLARSNGIEAAVNSAIHSADAVVAVLSRSDQRTSANVLVELGFALGAGKPVLIVSDAAEGLPAGVLTLPYVRTTGDARSDALHIVDRLLDLLPPGQRIHAKYGSADEELRTFETNPSYFESLDPRRFEELVADWFSAKHCVVQAPAEGDLGYDFSFETPSTGGLVLVEVKKSIPQSRVSVGDVRQLMQAAIIANAAAAILISTSGFTSAAVGLAEMSEVPLSLVTLQALLAAPGVHDLLERREAVAHGRTA